MRVASTTLVACALALLPVRASARVEPRPDVDGKAAMASVADAEAVLAGARVVIERGRVAARAGEYAAATEYWETAHRLLGSVIGLDVERQALAFELAHAHVHANLVDRDPQRLDRARTLLWGWVAHVSRPDHVATQAELDQLDRANELLEIILFRLRDAKQRAQAPALLDETPEPMARDERAPLRRANILCALGGAGIGLGGIALLAGALLRAGREHREPSVARSFSGAGALAAGGVLLVAGVTTLGFGIHERRVALGVSPSLSRTSGGIAVRGRF